MGTNYMARGVLPSRVFLYSFPFGDLQNGIFCRGASGPGCLWRMGNGCV